MIEQLISYGIKKLQISRSEQKMNFTLNYWKMSTVKHCTIE